MESVKGKLNNEDWRGWIKNIGIFATPLAIAFLTALQQGVPLKTAILFVYAAAINALIDLLRKLNAGSDMPQIPPLPQSGKAL